MDTYSCPCCKSKVKPKQLKKLHEQLPFEGMVRIAGKSGVESLVKGIGLDWACDDCLASKKAILGDPKKQFYQFKNPWDSASPFLAYWDRNYTCQTCRSKFTFSKEEQKHWFESLRFVVFSKPKNCRSCQKEKRANEGLNTRLSNLLKEGLPEEKEKLLEVAKIYQEMGKEDRFKYYRKLAEKKI